jgi:hypothetical protein
MVPTKSTLLAKPADTIWFHTCGLQQVISVMESPRSTWLVSVARAAEPGHSLTLTAWACAEVAAAKRKAAENFMAMSVDRVVLEAGLKVPTVVGFAGFYSSRPDVSRCVSLLLAV